MMQALTAVEADIPAWVALAASVEDLFGPMVDDPDFLAALRRNIARGTALCVRDLQNTPGAPLAGGLLLSPHPPTYEIAWLAVSRAHKGKGLGKLLVQRALETLMELPCTVEVTTFADRHPGGDARSFYEHLGFQPTDLISADGTRQTYRMQVSPR
jgi:GNAT superfamily N-acetyltransferase